MSASTLALLVLLAFTAFGEDLLFVRFFGCYRCCVACCLPVFFSSFADFPSLCGATHAIARSARWQFNYLEYCGVGECKDFVQRRLHNQHTRRHDVDNDSGGNNILVVVCCGDESSRHYIRC